MAEEEEPAARREDLLPRILRDLATLTAVSFSLAVSFVALTVPAPAFYVLENGVKPELRSSILQLTLAVLVLSVGCWGCGGWLRARRAGLEEAARFLQRWARRLRPLVVLFVPLFVLRPEVWHQSLFFSLASSAVAVWLGVLLWPGVERLTLPEIPKRAAWIVLAALVLTYVGYVSFHAVRHHHSLGTSAFDLGIMENVFWNTLHGAWFHTTVEVPNNHLEVHTSFFYVLLLPIYALAPRAETLLVIQTVAIAAAAWPLYAIVSRVGRSRTVALGFAAVYLLHPGVAGANFFDFHEVAFLPALALACFYFWLERRAVLMWIAVLLLLSVREDMGLIVASLGIYAVLEGRRREGAALAGVGAAAFLLLNSLIKVDGAWRYGSFYHAMIQGDEGPGGILTTLITNPMFALHHMTAPDKVLYLAQILAPVAFLCLLRVRSAVLLGYGLALTLLSAHQPIHQLGFQYGLYLIPFALVGAALTLAAWPRARRARALAVMALLAGIVCFQHGLISPTGHIVGGPRLVDFDYTEAEAARYAEVRDLVRRIPADASVTASENLVPHVADRPAVYTVRWTDVIGGLDADYYFFLKEDPVPPKPSKLPDPADYEKVAEGEFVVLFRRRD